MKKYILLILVSVNICALYAAAEKGSLVRSNDYPLTKHNAIEKALCNHLTPDPINLVQRYYGREWRPQTIEIQDLGRLITIKSDEEYIAANLQLGCIALLSPKTGKIARTLYVDPTTRSCDNLSLNSCMNFSPDGKLLAINGWNDNTVQITSILATDCFIADSIHSLDTQHIVNQIKFLKLDILLTLNHDPGAIKIWNTKTETCIQEIPFPFFGSFTTTSDNQQLAIGPPRYRKSGITSNSVEIWTANDDNTFDHSCTVKSKNPGLFCMAFSRDNKQLAMGFFQKKPLWGQPYSLICIKNIKNDKLIHTLKQHTESIESIAYSPTGLLATGACDGKITIWDPIGGKLLSYLESHKNAVTSLFFSPTGSHLVSTSHNIIKISEILSQIAAIKEDRCYIS